MPQARFVTYGYETGVAHSDSNQGVHELARTLLDGLAIFRRRTRSEQRPLCFVCHSLGGVVLKEALTISSRASGPEHASLHEVVEATRGLVLLGVPNLGLRHVQLRTVANGRPNEQFVGDLLGVCVPLRQMTHTALAAAAVKCINRPNYRATRLNR